MERRRVWGWRFEGIRFSLYAGFAR
jgi:hypothetical protein